MKKYLEFNNKIMIKKDGFFSLEFDKEAINLFEQYIYENMIKFDDYIDRIKFLINEKYYINFLSFYTEDDIKNLKDKVYSYNFKFKSFMAIYKFYQSYALKTDDRSMYLEKYEDRIIACALELAKGDYTKAEDFAISMIEQRYQPATPTFLNAGKLRRGEFASCYLLEMDDSLNSINYVLGLCGQLSKIGGGVAVNVSKLRSRGESIRGIKNISSGVVPVLKLLEGYFNYVDQLGQRQGAGAAYLNIFHNDIIEFLDTKKINSSEQSRLQTLSIAIIIPDKFLDCAVKNEDYYTFGPKSVFDEYGIHLDDMDMNIWYDKLINNKNIIKTLRNPRDILVRISKIQFESGYPYIIYKDNANKVHALKDIGTIKMTNLCTEIMQLQETSIINDYNEDDIINRDICCNLGSLNIMNVMDYKSIKESVYTAIDMLNSVSESIDITNAPGVIKANKELRAIGLGAMNLHGYLSTNGIPYESEYAKEFVNQFFMMVNFYSIKRSMETSKIKKSPFKDFEKSEYAKGIYFEKYIKNNYVSDNKVIKKLFEGMYIPTNDDWKQLSYDVKKYGLYNAYRLTIAPTQSIGYIQNATPSIGPIIDHIEIRTYGDSTTYYPMPNLSKDNLLFYKSAYKMDMFKVIDLMSVVQEHVDQAIAITLYADSNTTTKELVKYYMYAHKKNLKSLYYTRVKNLSFEECLSCSI